MLKSNYPQDIAYNVARIDKYTEMYLKNYVENIGNYIVEYIICLTHIIHLKGSEKKMECLSIGIIDEKNEMRNMIIDAVINLKNKDIIADMKQKKVADIDYFDIEIDSNVDSKNVKFYIANIISEYIIEKYEKKFILRIINSNYCYFNSFEKGEILNKSLDFMQAENEESVFNNIFLIRRKSIITKKLIEYMQNSNEIMLEGFITFRIKDYIKELEDVVDKAVDEYLTEKEYKEFIRLLKYFVEIQEPKVDIVHVIAFYDNKYALLDSSGNEITNECIKDFVNEVSEGEINYDDLLVSSLITLAPNKVYIHMPEYINNKELIKTIKNIFLKKVVFCEGCDICAKSSKLGVGTRVVRS